MKQWLDSKQILYYKRYVDDILIIYSQNKTNEHDILNHGNNTDKHLQLKLSTEENNLINYLDPPLKGLRQQLQFTESQSNELPTDNAFLGNTADPKAIYYYLDLKLLPVQ
jgi:hypothetical protein